MQKARWHALSVLQNTASVTAAEYTGAAGSVQENSYMDDYPEFNQTVEKAKQKTQDLPFPILCSCCLANVVSKVLKTMADLNRNTEDRNEESYTSDD